ncbi:MAG: hypothetical protein H6811_04620 [Phycisphaeraceae bacterium]|nr:hypothetical protein [Phycisphaeraceae bacterium]
MEAGPPDLDKLIALVVGACPQAEWEDRPIAEILRMRLSDRLDAQTGVRPIILTDLWYLSHAEWRTRPTIAIGGPGANALTAYLASRLPSTLTLDDRATVQFDPQWTEPVVACWGVDQACTRWAVQGFVDRYLDGFMSAVDSGVG